MKEKTLLETARDAVEMARKAGAKDVAANAFRSRQVTVEWRDGKLERTAEATTRGVGLELYVDGRYSALSTSDLRPDALARFVKDSVGLTRKLAVDPHRLLPDPKLYEGQARADLELDDPKYAEVDGARRRALAQAQEEAARAVSGAKAILSVSTGVSDTSNESARVHSNGFEGSQRNTSFTMGTDVSVTDPDGRRPEDWDYAAMRRFADLPAAAVVGRTAAERALGRIGAKKTDSAVMPMIVANRAAGRLVSSLFAPLAAASLQQKRSFYEGKVGQQVGSKLLDFTDDPHVVRGLGSRLYDGEGLAARRFPIFAGGVLKNYYVDNYYGRKLGLAPTTRGYSNLAWTLGAKDEAALLADVKEGILVTGFLGGNSNGTTGDFSMGVQGYRVRAGRPAEPVAEMNIAGNHLTFWNQLAALGNNPFLASALRTPTLVFDGVQFAGV